MILNSFSRFVWSWVYAQTWSVYRHFCVASTSFASSRCLHHPRTKWLRNAAVTSRQIDNVTEHIHLHLSVHKSQVVLRSMWECRICSKTSEIVSSMEICFLVLNSSTPASEIRIWWSWQIWPRENASSTSNYTRVANVGELPSCREWMLKKASIYAFSLKRDVLLLISQRSCLNLVTFCHLALRKMKNQHWRLLSATYM